MNWRVIIAIIIFIILFSINIFISLKEGADNPPPLEMINTITTALDYKPIRVVEKNKEQAVTIDNKNNEIDKMTDHATKLTSQNNNLTQTIGQYQTYTNYLRKEVNDLIAYIQQQNNSCSTRINGIQGQLNNTRNELNQHHYWFKQPHYTFFYKYR